MVFIHDITNEHELQKQMEDTYFSVIEAFAGLIDAKDDYTGEHSNNVLNYASRLCKELKLDDKLIRDISLAAKIHDIGKIGVRSSILNKPGKLTEDEYMIMKQHCSIGAKIIKKNLFPDLNIEIEYRYCGAFASTQDNLGFLGKDPNNSKLWYGLGYGANGILFAVLGGIMQEIY